ncbi:MAG: hypothetical protein RLZZ292_1581 [Bacteroidota bacterium]|jgi:hypothetical protein
MSRRRQQLGRTMLIICEGENTEPLYFEELRQVALQKGDWFEIEIRPSPKLELAADKLASKRKKRSFYAAETETDENRLLKELKELDLENEYENYKMVPLRYVKEAQLAVDTEAYDEVWAVFDKNGHPKHAEAFEYTKNKSILLFQVFLLSIGYCCILKKMMFLFQNQNVKIQ